MQGEPAPSRKKHGMVVRCMDARWQVSALWGDYNYAASPRRLPNRGGLHIAGLRNSMGLQEVNSTDIIFPISPAFRTTRTL